MSFWQNLVSKFTGAEQEQSVPLPVEKLSCKARTEKWHQPYKPVVLVSCGSFNPPTVLHLRMFEVARDHLQKEGYDVLGAYMSPVNDAYGKTGLQPAKHRLAMAEACASESDMVMVDSWEASQPKYQRSLHVLDRIQTQLKQAFGGPPPPTTKPVQAGEVKAMLLCGSDMLESMTKPGVWIPDQLDTLLKNHGIVCISRNSGDAFKEDALIEKDEMLHKHKDCIKVVPEPVANNVSSTLVRDLLQEGKSVKYLMPDAARQYIKEHRLYRAK